MKKLYYCVSFIQQIFMETYYALLHKYYIIVSTILGAGTFIREQNRWASLPSEFIFIKKIRPRK